MALNNNLLSLISQVAKLTVNKGETTKETTAWGEVVEVTESGKCFVQLDGSDRVTPVITTTEVKAGDRVSVTIKNHAATLTGNTSSPSINANGSTIETIRTDYNNLSADNILIRGKIIANEGSIAELTAKNLIVEETLEAHAGKFDNLEADVAELERLSATYATFDHLTAKEAEFRSLLADYATVSNLNATNAKITSLEAEDASIRNLFASYATVENLNATNAKIASLEAEDANIHSLFASYATISYLQSNYANITTLEANYAKINDLTANYAKIVDLEAVRASVGSLDADIADINTLIFGSATGTSIQTSFANAVVALLGDAQIKSAMIKDVSASKITAGDIITDNVNVKSNDGRLLIADQTIRISDSARVRVQIGKDASNDYSINIWDANGKLMFSEGGLTEDAVKEKIIRNDMVKDDANISASKLDINTLFDVINDDDSHTLKSNKIKFDEKNQTLDVAFGALTTKVDGISVGGRNLISGTSLDTVYSGVADSNLGYKDVWTSKTINTPTETEYVISFEAKADEAATILCFFFSPNTTLTSESSTGNSRTGVTDGHSSVDITTEWKRYWVKWTQTPADNKKNVIVGRHYSQTNRVYIRAIKLEVGNKATDWTPAPEDVNGALTTLDSKYTSLSVTIDGLSSTLSEQSQAISAKADGSIVESLITQYSDLNQTLEGLSQTVGSHTTQIANKADGSKVTEVSNKVTTLESNLNGFKTTVTNTYATRVDLSNLTVGGRNLLLNTVGGEPVVMRGDATVKTSGIQSSTNVDGIQTLNCSVTSTELYYRFMTPITTNLYGLIPGETYIFSGKAKVSTTSGTLEHLSTRTQYNPGNGWSGGAATVILTEDSDEWVSFESKFTVEPNSTGYYVSLQLYYTGSWVGTIQLKDLKLEQGTKATDWSPAPEDMLSNNKASSMYATQSELAVEAGKISANVATTNDLSTRMANLELAADGITLRVDNLSMVGRNLIANTSQDEIVLGAYPSSGYNEGKTGTTIDVPSGDKYVLSFDAKSTVDGDTIQCHFYNPNTTTSVVTSTGYTSSAVDGTARVKLTTEWKRYWIKYSQNGASTTTKKSWIIGRRSPGNGTGSISIRAIKLEAGDQPSPWTAAPEDTVTYVSSQIKQLADSIDLSVTGALGSTASIKLTVNGAETTNTIDMSGVRNAFANDTTAISISAGTVTFSSNTFVVDSTYFKVSSNGTITATGGTIGGMTLWSDGIYSDGGSFPDAFGGLLKYNTTTSTNGYCFFAGASDKTGKNANFYVTHLGKMYANGGTIGGMTLWSDGIYSDGGSFPDAFGGLLKYSTTTSTNGYCFFAGASDKTGTNANFYVTHLGKMYANDAVIEGNITTTNTSGTISTTLAGGELAFYYDGVLQASISSERYTGLPLDTLTLYIPREENRETFLMFAHESSTGNPVVDYQMHSVDTDGVTSADAIATDIKARHTFYGGMAIGNGLFVQGEIYPTGHIYMRNLCAIGWWDKDKGGPQQLISFDNENVLNISNKSYDTHVRGTLTLSNGYQLRAKNKSGSNVNIMHLGTENNLIIGYGMYSGSIGSTYLYANETIYFKTKKDTIEFCPPASSSSCSAYLRPGTDNKIALGTSSRRWYSIHVTTVNEGSDRRIKKDIEVLSDTHSELFDKLQPVQYRLINDDTRIHYGLVAQDVEAAMVELGIGKDDLSLVHHDYEVDSETGELNDSYEIAYRNLIPMLIHEVQKLKHKIKILEGE